MAYQTKFVNFDEHITGLSKFLQNKAGTIKITHNFKGFFPRFLAGTLKKNIQSYSFTHTYYDCTTCATDDDYWNNNNENFNDSSILIPLFIKDDYYTDLVLYPTFSPSNSIGGKYSKKSLQRARIRAFQYEKLRLDSTC